MFSQSKKLSFFFNFGPLPWLPFWIVKIWSQIRNQRTKNPYKQVLVKIGDVSKISRSKGSININDYKQIPITFEILKCPSRFFIEVLEWPLPNILRPITSISVMEYLRKWILKFFDLLTLNSQICLSFSANLLLVVCK